MVSIGSSISVYLPANLLFNVFNKSSKLEVNRSAVGDLPVSFSYLLLNVKVALFFTYSGDYYYYYKPYFSLSLLSMSL
jgi:hypothetical protein